MADNNPIIHAESKNHTEEAQNNPFALLQAKRGILSKSKSGTVKIYQTNRENQEQEETKSPVKINKQTPIKTHDPLLYSRRKDKAQKSFFLLHIFNRESCPTFVVI